MKQYFLLFMLIFFIYFSQGCNAMATVTRGTAEFNAAIKANPDILNNQDIAKVRLNSSMDPNAFDGVVLENMTIRNLNLRDVQMRGARLKNVTFIDCKFYKADFNYSTFSNVKFIRGSMAGDERPDRYEDYETSFKNVTIDRVLFDGVFFDKSVRIDFNHGLVVMRNITTTSKTEDSAWLIAGSDLRIRMDNCKVNNQSALVVQGDNSSAYITNSYFANANLDLSGNVAWIENCTLSKASTPAVSRLVLRNSRLLDGINVMEALDTDSKVFLVDNIYDSHPAKIAISLLGAFKKTSSNSHLYLYADAGTHIPGNVIVTNGNIYIYNVEIDSLLMRQQRSNRNVANLNLYNVTIKKGDWEYADVRQGKWQNVQIYPPVDIKDAKFGKIIGHKVEFPQGTPWKNGSLEITNSYEPLEFDKPPVPTLEELGLAQFWKENDFPVETY